MCPPGNNETRADRRRPGRHSTLSDHDIHKPRSSPEGLSLVCIPVHRSTRCRRSGSHLPRKLSPKLRPAVSNLSWSDKEYDHHLDVGRTASYRDRCPLPIPCSLRIIESRTMAIIFQNMRHATSCPSFSASGPHLPTMVETVSGRETLCHFRWSRRNHSPLATATQNPSSRIDRGSRRDRG